jgi:Spy/CpxP family protein refolding chaperone
VTGLTRVARVARLSGRDTKRAEARLRCCRTVRRGQAAGEAWFRPSPKEAVMKTLMAAVALVVGVLVFATLLAPADAQGGQKGTGGLAERMQDLHLTDQQETRIMDLRKEFRPKVQEANKALHTLVKEEVDKVQAVLTPAQKTKLEAAKEERREHRAEGLAQRIAHLEELDLTDAEVAKIADIRKEYRPKVNKAMHELGDILTDAQKTAREEALKAGKKHREVIEALKLTDAQKEKLTAVCKNVCGLVREEMEHIRDVFNEEQKIKLAEFKDERHERVHDRKAHRIATMKDLNLTEEQRTQIGNIRKEYRTKVHEAANHLRATIREEVEAIVTVIKKG